MVIDIQINVFNTKEMIKLFINEWISKGLEKVYSYWIPSIILEGFLTLNVPITSKNTFPIYRCYCCLLYTIDVNTLPVCEVNIYSTSNWLRRALTMFLYDALLLERELEIGLAFAVLNHRMIFSLNYSIGPLYFINWQLLYLKHLFA